MSTGHSCMHAPHVVQAHTTSSSTTWGTSVVASEVSPRARAARIAGPSANSWSRRSMTSSFGDSGLPVFHAGHALWQRPHSVHAYRSSSSLRVRSTIVPAPSDCSPASSASRLIGSGVSVPRGFVLEKKTLRKLVAMWRCFEYVRNTRNPKISSRCAHRKVCSSMKSQVADRSSNGWASRFETGVHAAGDSLMPCAMRIAFARNSVRMIQVIQPRIR